MYRPISFSWLHFTLQFDEQWIRDDDDQELKMKTKMKTYPFYITLQACVAITFVFVIIMTVRYSSSSVAFFEIKPEAVAKITSLFDQQQQAVIINPQSERLKKQSSSSLMGKDKQSHKPFDYILENQRIRIATEMDQFPFENSHQQLLDLIPESGGQPKRAMVIKLRFKVQIEHRR